MIIIQESTKTIYAYRVSIGYRIFCCSFSGGVVEAVQSINQSHAEHLGNPGPAGQWTSQGWLGMFFAATVTCIAWPQVFQRMYLFKYRKSIRQMAILGWAQTCQQLLEDCGGEEQTNMEQLQEH